MNSFFLEKTLRKSLQRKNQVSTPPYILEVCWKLRATRLRVKPASSTHLSYWMMSW